MTIGVKHTKDAEIRRLNDRLRVEGRGGYYKVCDRLFAYSYKRYAEVERAIRGYDDFCCDNDPQGHHSRGQVVVRGKQFAWEIGYLGSDGTGVSPDPSDPEVTTRFMLITML